MTKKLLDTALNMVCVVMMLNMVYCYQYVSVISYICTDQSCIISVSNRCFTIWNWQRLSPGIRMGLSI